jgi:hypothetical protein
MAAPELPVIYENPRFDAATPTLQPVINRAIRFGAVLMIEWGTLTLIEGAPRYLKIATLVIAVLVLAVHESWPWLRMRSRYWYPSLMGGLLSTFVGICIYAFATEPQISHSPTTTATTTVTPSSAPTPVDHRKNPFDDATAKWQLAQRLHYITSVEKIPKCKILLLRYPLPFAENYSDDLKEVLKVMDWEVAESIAVSALQKGLSVIAVGDGTSDKCANAFVPALRNSGGQWHGGSPIPVRMNVLSKDDNEGNAVLIRGCGTCMILTIGNDIEP